MVWDISRKTGPGTLPHYFEPWLYDDVIIEFTTLKDPLFHTLHSLQSHRSSLGAPLYPNNGYLSMRGNLNPVALFNTLRDIPFQRPPAFIIAKDGDVSNFPLATLTEK